MPRIRTTSPKPSAAQGWEQVIVNQLRTGRVLPVIGNRIHNDLLLDGHDRLLEDFGTWAEYPFEDKRNLPRVTLYRSIINKEDVARPDNLVKDTYLDFVKSRIMELAEGRGIPQELIDEADAEFEQLSCTALADRLGLPAFGAPDQDPLLILAQMDLPIYLTTSYHGFIEAALASAGKQPRGAVCRWRGELETLDDPFEDGYEPTRDEPLVFHLHGSDTHPESLVLTEDDHLAFLMEVARIQDRIPQRLHQAIAQCSLMLLGYDLRDWDFRSLFWGLVEPRQVPQDGVCVLQIHPGEEESRYLDLYLRKVAFKVKWGGFADYVRGLHTQLNPA